MIPADGVVGNAKVASSDWNEGNDLRRRNDDHGGVFRNSATVIAHAVEFVVGSQGIGRGAFRQILVFGAVEECAPISIHAVLGACCQSKSFCSACKVVTQVVRAIIVSAVFINRKAVGIRGNLRADFCRLRGGGYRPDRAVVVGYIVISTAAAKIADIAVNTAVVVVVIGNGPGPRQLS